MPQIPENEFSQHAYECGTHPGCTVIVGFEGTRLLWESHMHAAVAPEIRVNLDHPEVHDKRHTDESKHEVKAWRLANPQEAKEMGWDDEIHHAVAYHAHRKGLVTEVEAVSKLEAVPDVDTFHQLAEEKRLHEPFDGKTPARLKGGP